MVLNGLAWVALTNNDPQRAAPILAEGLTLFRHLGSKIDISLCIEGLASVAAMSGEGERAARLFGAARSIRDGIGVDLAETTEQHYTRHRQTTRAALTPAQWEAAWDGGYALPLADAIAEALANPDL